MAAAYAAVHLWKNAAEKAGSVDPTVVLEKVRGSTYQGPRGASFVDNETQHLWLPARIAKVNDAGRAEILPGSGANIRPIPYPETRSREEWERFLNDLYLGWNGHWHAPLAK
jgi:urea transport system substrate-binding protein